MAPVPPTLNIKDPEVYRLAAELAKRRRVSMTAAVRQALAETLERSHESRAGMAERLMEIGRQAADKIEREGLQILTDEDIYDEWGLPK
jgi:antitoxin VapB